MDFAIAKARLVRLTRETFGEVVTIRPMKAGEMKVVADPNRAVMEDIAARFDQALDTPKLGGGDKMGPLMVLAESNPSFSIARGALLWLPAKSDRIERADGEVHEIVRVGEDGNGAVILYVSKAN